MVCKSARYPPAANTPKARVSSSGVNSPDPRARLGTGLRGLTIPSLRAVAAIRSGPSAFRITEDDAGNPVLHSPGDYNVLVPGHRELDARS